MALQKTTLTVWHDPDLLDVDSLLEFTDQYEGVEFAHVGEQVDSAAAYDEERGTYVIPGTEIHPQPGQPTPAQVQAAEAALRELDSDEGNWPTGEQVEAIIAAVTKTEEN